MRRYANSWHNNVENPRCDLCHRHFDGLGLSLESFDPIGRVRDKDLAGRAVDNVGIAPDETAIHGVDGLIRYVKQHRQDDFAKTFCRKLLGYALGRSVVLSDKSLLDQMERTLQENEYRIVPLLKTVVLSQQFRRQRRGGP